MVICAVFGCKNSSKKKSAENVSFLTFPVQDPDLCNAWVAFCRRDDKFNCKFARVCTEHFDSTCFQWNLRHQLLSYSPKHSRKVAPGSVPTLKGPKAQTSNAETEESRSARQLRKENRASRKRTHEMIESSATS
jgi:THAP domain